MPTMRPTVPATVIDALSSLPPPSSRRGLLTPLALAALESGVAFADVAAYVHARGRYSAAVLAELIEGEPCDPR